MDRIVFDLRPGMDGQAVADLQDGLRLLLERRALLFDDQTRREMLSRLADERAPTAYRDATTKLVTIFQEQRGLPQTGEVDAKTAAHLNEVLESLGAFGGQEQRPLVLVVAGRVVDEAGGPFTGVRARAFHVADRGAIRLGADDTDREGRYTIPYSPLPDASVLRLQVVVSDQDGNPLAESEIMRGADPVQVIDIVAPRPPAPTERRKLEGRVLLDHGAPAGKTTLRLYRTGFGGVAQLVDTTVTSASGDYSFAYDLGPRAGTLELRALAGGEEITLSRPLTHMGDTATARVDLIAPAKVHRADAEYVRLTAAVAPRVGAGKLADARETDERRDLSELNSATGWDARLIALAATAQRLEADPQVELPAQPLYGLFRAGLPTDPLMLAQVEPEVVGEALGHLTTTGIVAMQPAEIAEFVEEHRRFSNKVRLSVPAPGSRTTYGELLDAAAIGDAKDRFTPIFLNHRGEGAGLWESARQAGVAEPVISRLQWQGKLAFLAANSGPVTARLMRKLEDQPLQPGAGTDLRSPAELVKQDLHLPEQWKVELRAMAVGEELAALIPPSYTGATTDERLDAYAEDMARKLRVSYPTQVVAQMVRNDSLPVDGTKDATVALLEAAAPKGFRLGQTPVEAFLQDNGDLSVGLAAEEAAAVTETVKTLHRVYQITPSDADMPVMMALGLTSAYDVTALREADFAQMYIGKYREIHGRTPAAGLPRLVWRKAHQVSSMSYNLFGVTRKVASDPALSTISGTPQQRAAEQGELKAALKGYPTMESLFGSLDFCECDHCRSVLSPAAYLVDLLQFLEDEPPTWADFLARWKNRNGSEYTDTFLAPYDALTKRRPDLPHIPLTCENTNVALPYIDVVNEILEYYVAHERLTEDAARDTGDATSAELLAEPQNVIAAAYTKLRDARYPLTLPFDLWLETVRQFCHYAETPLPQVLETFRRTDALLEDGPDHDRADIFLESLGLTPGERAIFTDPDPLAAWWELYGYPSEMDATTEAVDAGQRVDLNSAKALSRRLGVTYAELVEIVETGFVNPELATLGVLYKLPASIAELRLVLNPENRAFHAANSDLLAAEFDDAQQARFAALSEDDWQRLVDLGALADRVTAYATEFGLLPADVLAELEAIPLEEILVLADKDAGGSFDATVLRYADGHPADDEAFLRINLFVRLWRKLGWTIEETDQAVQLFTPADAPFVAAHFAKRPLQTTLIGLAHLKTLDEKITIGRQSRTKLMTLWSDLAVTGRNPLYAQLFLARSILQTDPVFDHPRGEYLDPAWVATQGQGRPVEFVLVKSHLPAIRGALGLTATDVAEILRDAGTSVEAAPLTLANVSILYRYGLLAKALRLTPHDLITLKALAGTDPFHPLDPGPLADLAKDHPYTGTLAFVEIADMVRRSGLTIADLDFLLRRRFDDAGPHRRDRAAILTLLTTLADGARTIRTEHAVPEDAGALTEEFLQDKVSLLLPPPAAQRLLRMLRGEEPLDAGTRSFFDDQLRTQPVRLADDAGFLDEADYPSLFEPLKPLKAIVPGDTPEEAAAKRTENAQIQTRNREELLRRRQRIAQTFLPVLGQRLIRTLATRTLAAQTGADTASVESLVIDGRLLAVGDRPLVDAFAAAGQTGVDADFFTSVDGTGDRQPTASRVATADTALKDSGGGVPATNSARFAGYLVVPADGAYRFYVQLAKQDATAKLIFPHLPKPVFLDVTAGTDDTELGTGETEFVELKAGVPYRFALQLNELDGGAARLLVRGETSGKGPLSQLRLYSAAALETAEQAYELLVGALLLVQALGLSQREIHYILTHPDQWGGVDLSALPTHHTGDTPDEVAAVRELFAQFLRLAAYARLKADLAGGTDDLIGVFEADGTAGDDRLANAVYPMLGRLTRRDPAVVSATAEALSDAPVFDSDEPVRRLWEALHMVQRLGATAADIRRWTTIISSAADDEQRVAVARDVKAAVKARFDAPTWQRVAQPVFDRLRRRQRDALVAHVMHLEAFTRPEQLYEYFLVDPGMEPVVQTSRIRLAIATVQLFVQRCLLNLEREVHPSAIMAADQWEWMKRYRVWEANRKIFLFPENWLEPEFRDDKTHLFTELEGKLLQSDVSADTVDDVFLGYLRKLEELGRLDIVAMHVENKAQFAQNTLHVFGRTFGVPHKYFHRRYADRTWSPWVPVTAEIEGDHLAPVVWRDRLYLFWLTFLEKGRPTGFGPVDTNEPIPLPGVQKQVEVQLHWSEFVDGQWSTPESGGYSAPEENRIRVDVGATFTPQDVLVKVDVVEPPDPDQESIEKMGLAGVYITMSPPIGGAFHLANRNSPPRPTTGKTPLTVPYTVEHDEGKRRPTRYIGAGEKLSVTFSQTISTDPGATRTEPVDILAKAGRFTILPCNNTVTLGVSAEAYEVAERPDEVRTALEKSVAEIERLMKPVFFQDDTQTLFVEPEVTERTLEEWEEWVTRTPTPGGPRPDWLTDARWWGKLVVPAFPKDPQPDLFGPVVHVPDPGSLIQVVDKLDWLVNPTTSLLFDGQVIGPKGMAAKIVPAGDLAAATAKGARVVQVNAGSAVTADTVVILPTAGVRGQLAMSSDPQAAGSGINIVGAGGFNGSLLQNVRTRR